MKFFAFRCDLIAYQVRISNAESCTGLCVPRVGLDSREYQSG